MVPLSILQIFGACKYKTIESFKNRNNDGYVISSRNIKET